MSDTNSLQTMFLHSQPRSGTVFDFPTEGGSTLVSGWNASHLEMPSGATHFGFVGSANAVLNCASGVFELRSGMYFSVPGAGTVEGNGFGIVSSLDHYGGLFQIGGPVENQGRLRYIDGCSDTLLIASPTLGDPCLNLLHIPPRTDQTAHTHPSLRVGMVFDGEGCCQIPGQQVRLSAGLLFAIQPGGLHSFHTADQSLRIIAWHPDSDFGPTHDQHPMLNRTLVSGQPINAIGGQR